MNLKKILVFFILFSKTIYSETKSYNQLKKTLEQEVEKKFKISDSKSIGEIDFPHWFQVTQRDRKIIRAEWEAVLHDIKHFVDAYDDLNSDAIKCYFYIDDYCQNNKFDNGILPTIFDLNKSLFNILINTSEYYLHSSPQFYQILSEKIQRLKSLINNLKISVQELKVPNIKSGSPVWLKADHEAKAIILDTLNIYEKIAKKIFLYYFPNKEQLKQDISNNFYNIFLNPTIRISNNISSDNKERLQALLLEFSLFLSNSESQDIPKLLENDYGLSPLTNSLISVINKDYRSLEDKNKLLKYIDSLQTKFTNLSNSLNSVFTLRQGPKEAKEVFRLFLDKIFKVIDKLKAENGLYLPSILMNLALTSNINFGLPYKYFPEISNIKSYKQTEFNLKNWNSLNKENKARLEIFTKALQDVTNFISDFMLGKNPYICFVKYYEQDKCKLPNGDKQVTIWDLYDDLLSFIDRTKSLPTTQGFKRDETEFKDKLNKFENNLKAVKINHTQYEKESKILLEYIVKIYKKVVDKLKVDYKL